MHKKDLVATGSWLLIGLILWVAAWVIAEAIPVFNNLLSLIVGAFDCGTVTELTDDRRLFSPAGLPVRLLPIILPRSPLTVVVGVSAACWLYLNKDCLFATPMKVVLTLFNVLLMGIAACIVSVPGSSTGDRVT